MNAASSLSHRLLPRALRVAAASFGLGAVGLVAACSVETIQPNTRPAVANTCKEQSDCGSNGVCTNGACYSRSGVIDEVLLEILPEATSSLGSISFLSMQNDLRRGDRARSIALTGPVHHTVQLVLNGEDHVEDCPALRPGKQTVPARIEFRRTGSVGGLSVAGLSDRSDVTIDTEQSATGFSKNVSLVPGYYDVYAQPVGSANCQIAAKVWHGVAVPRDGQVVAWAPPSTLELPRPINVSGTVERTGGESLADWQVEILDPLDGKVISTSRRLGATTATAPVTNFRITYQPPEHVVTTLPSGLADKPNTTAPVIRLRPPKALETTAPTVYFDLDGWGTGVVNMKVSSLPTPAQLVKVTGQVRGTGNEPVRATVKFLNQTLREDGLPSAFGPSATTDGNGSYTARLFPGKYTVVVTPEGVTDIGGAAGVAPRTWALTQLTQFVGTEPDQVIDIGVAKIRTVVGTASAGRDSVVAQGATLEAVPVIASSEGIVRTVLAPPISPARASTPVRDDTGAFDLAIDPGYYTMFLKPAPQSNFAWWIYPIVHVVPEPPDPIRPLNPQLLYPVPLEGTITVTTGNTSQPLRNATVQAYARATQQGAQPNVLKVGVARTDDTGHYYLALPPTWHDQ